MSKQSSKVMPNEAIVNGGGEVSRNEGLDKNDAKTFIHHVHSLSINEISIDSKHVNARGLISTKASHGAPPVLSHVKSPPDISERRKSIMETVKSEEGYSKRA